MMLTTVASRYNHGPAPAPAKDDGKLGCPPRGILRRCDGVKKVTQLPAPALDPLLQPFTPTRDGVIPPLPLRSFSTSPGVVHMHSNLRLVRKFADALPVCSVTNSPDTKNYPIYYMVPGVGTSKSPAGHT